MAEINTVIAEASQDLQTIEDFVNLPADSEVYPRLLPSVNVGTLAGTRDAIFKAGGLPATPFATKALMTASALANGSYAQVTEDSVESNNGLYYKSQGSWAVSKYNPLLQAKNYANSNPLFKPVLLKASDNLNDFNISGLYIKQASGDIDLANNYPVKLAGFLRVDATSASSCIQEYTVFSSGIRYRRHVFASVFTPWKSYDATDVEPKYLVPIEWQAGAGTTAIYDSSTRTVTMTGLIIAAYQNTQRRIKIESFSRVLSGDYDVCYIDLKALGDTRDITAVNADDIIKVGTYGTASNRYFADIGQLPLFKYDQAQGKAVSCAGFIPVSGGSTGDIATTGLEFEKTARRLNVYFPQTSGNKLQVGFERFTREFGASEPDANMDLWRIYTASSYKSDDVLQSLLVSTGEWELTIKHEEDTHTAGDKDHVGGYHGDEVKTSVEFYVDGVGKPEDFVTSRTNAKEVQIAQHSVIYFQGTTRPICDRTKLITFKDGVVNVKQRIDFKYEAVSLIAAWTAMLPIRREESGYSVTEKSSRSIDYFTQIDDNSTSSFSNRYTPVTDGSVIKQWSETNGISATTTLVKTAGADESQSMYVTNSPLYNKLYVSAKDAAQLLPMPVALNDVWEIETEYEIKC